MNRRLEAVLFDLDDTLHDDTSTYRNAAERVAREVAAEHDVDAIALKNAYVAQAEGFWKSLSADQLKRRMSQVRVDLWQTALRLVGIDDESVARRSAERYHDYRRRTLALFPGVLDLLHELRASGIKVGLLTNGVSETHHEKIALLQLAEAFDAIFLADEVGMIKPDPLLFAHACQKMTSRPSASAMVGDRYDRDVAGAMRAGLFAVWVNVRNESLPAGAAPPDAEVGTIAEVGAVLARLRNGHDG